MRTLEDADDGTEFNQFEENEKKVGHKSTYDWSMYSTTIDHSKLSEEAKQKASEIAKQDLMKKKDPRFKHYKEGNHSEDENEEA